jgi:ADP-heptose:LPS heptosyltransferase
VSWDGVRALLAVRLDALGDVLMTTPALRALRAGRRLDRRITLLTSPAGGEVAALVPDRRGDRLRRAVDEGDGGPG